MLDQLLGQRHFVSCVGRVLGYRVQMAAAVVVKGRWRTLQWRAVGVSVIGGSGEQLWTGSGGGLVRRYLTVGVDGFPKAVDCISPTRGENVDLRGGVLQDAQGVDRCGAGDGACQGGGCLLSGIGELPVHIVQVTCGSAHEESQHQLGALVEEPEF
ncbi:hypothetical protein ACFYO6_12195 [Streptomyces anthocyanicus]|uniref:hypothetical protein n=1 Tax=Streptomyces TaxID=1883 RepID=UPI00363805E5